MSTISFPLDSSIFTPRLPELPSRKLSWLGRLVQWIRLSETRGIAVKVIAHTITFFGSFLLLCSIVGAPLFILGFKEFIEQTERAFFQEKREKLIEVGTVRCEQEFLRGRVFPLDYTTVELGQDRIKQIRFDLEIKPHEVFSNQELLQRAAVKYENYLDRYLLKIAPSPRRFPFFQSEKNIPLIPREAPPSLPTYKNRELTKIGQGMEWIRTAETRGIIQKTLTYALAFFASTVLLFSLIGIPLFLLCFKEFITQKERIIYNSHYENLCKRTFEQGRKTFLTGRLEPLQNIQVELDARTTDKILSDHTKLDPIPHSYKDLLKIAALHQEDFLSRYNLAIIQERV